MQRLVIATMLAVAAWMGAPAFAQPLPDTLRSSSLTRAQEGELNRRLAQLQQRFGALARETDLREAAVRNVAIEIFGADPSLDFETYVALIDNGARELRTYLTDARTRSDPDPAAAAIRQRAIAAAEDGRLTEARGLYDQLIAANRSARQRARDAEDLADAADMAEAARLAYVSADYLDAARRYGEAAELAPEGTRERWAYTVMRAAALYDRSRLFSEPEPLRLAIEYYDAALALRPQGSSDWATVQINLSSALLLQGVRGVPGALERAEAAAEAAQTVATRRISPVRWARAQTNLGWALQLQGRRGLSFGALERSVSAFEAVAAVLTREAHPTDWAIAQLNLGNSHSILGDRGTPGAFELAVAAYDAALTVLTREADPARWALIQMNLGVTLRRQGERGAPGALEQAVAAYEAALTVQTRDADPASWARTQMNLGDVLRIQAERGAPGALERAIAAYEAALTVQSPDGDPAGWSRTQMNLGIALRIQGERGAPGALQRSVAALEAALTLQSLEIDPVDWADTQLNLAFTYRAMRRNREARAAAQDALAVYEQVGNAYWADQARAFIARLPPQ